MDTSHLFVTIPPGNFSQFIWEGCITLRVPSWDYLKLSIVVKNDARICHTGRPTFIAISQAHLPLEPAGRSQEAGNMASYMVIVISQAHLPSKPADRSQEAGNRASCIHLDSGLSVHQFDDAEMSTSSIKWCGNSNLFHFCFASLTYC